jgi:hypothetical protein
VADAGIKKVTVFRPELPAINATSNSYNIRYRIVSEDRNRFSAWSTIAQVAAPEISLLTYSVSVNNADLIITAVWNPNPDLALTSYDVFVRWIGNNNTDTLTNYPWTFAANTLNNNHLFSVPPTIPNVVGGGTEDVHKIQIALQRASYQRTKEDYPTSEVLTLFQTAVITI